MSEASLLIHATCANGLMTGNRFLFAGFQKDTQVEHRILEILSIGATGVFRG
jgi:hypothetical protein